MQSAKFGPFGLALGGDSEAVEDDALNLAARRTASRLTFTLGKISVKDIFDRIVRATPHGAYAIHTLR